MMGKGNDGAGNIPERDLWETSQEFWEKLNSQYLFEVDCCANEKNTKCDTWTNDFMKFYNDLNKCCWMNPPFSKAYDMFKHFFHIAGKGVAIYRCDNMETKVWQDIILKYADWIFIPKGRISYTPFNITIRGGMTRFPSALIGVGVEPPFFDLGIDGTLLWIGKNK